MNHDLLLERFKTLFVSRATDYARQHTDGRYTRVGQPLTREVLLRHLRGEETVGGYVIDVQGNCRYACFDADGSDGMTILLSIQVKLATSGIPSLLETSRRGGHLWVFLAQPMPASQLRAWLLPYNPPGVEFFPKQDEGRGYGSLVRLPLGVHQRTGQRYPFVEERDGQIQPIAPTLLTQLHALRSIKQVVPPKLTIIMEKAGKVPVQSLSSHQERGERTSSIRDWCAGQDPFPLIGRYVQLDALGRGCCPFGEHHQGGRDSHPSLQVYLPRRPGDWCWFCHTWGKGGNQFNFLAMYYHLSGRDLWQRLQAGGLF